MLLTGAASSLIMPSLAPGIRVLDVFNPARVNSSTLRLRAPTYDLTGSRRFAMRAVASYRSGE